MSTTLHAMKRIEEICSQRKERFKMLRRKDVKKIQKREAIREIKKSINLIAAPVAKKRLDIIYDQVHLSDTNRIKENVTHSSD